MATMCLDGVDTDAFSNPPVQSSVLVVRELGLLVYNNIECQIASLIEVLLYLPEGNIPQAAKLVFLTIECGRKGREVAMYCIVTSDWDEE